MWRFLRAKRQPAQLTYDGTSVRVAMPFSGAEQLGIALDALTAWNMRAMQDRPLPPLYQAGVLYEREPMCRNAAGRETMCEEFVTAHEVVRRGWGDCDDLGPFLAAQLRLQGEQAQAFAHPSPAGWHVVVRRGDGSIEDPSAKLGMPTS